MTVTFFADPTHQIKVAYGFSSPGGMFDIRALHGQSQRVPKEINAHCKVAKACASRWRASANFSGQA